MKNLKKIIVLVGAIITINLIYISTASGDASSDSALLKQIEQHTRDTANFLNTLPEHIQKLNNLISAWMKTDDSDTTIGLQTSFKQLTDLLKTDLNTQQSQQSTLNQSLLNNDGANVFNINNNENKASTVVADSKTLWYANDLVYSSVLGQPYFAKDPRGKNGAAKIDPALNYIKNASGINIYHVIPNAGWGGKLEAISRYQNYFNIVMAAESFNAYVLSNQYADRNQLNTLQAKLLDQATDQAKWFAQVGSENIGFVLRQLLLYQSQLYVLMTQLIQSQRQMVTAQAMTNSILIAANQTNESLLVSNAKNEAPKL